VLYSLSAYLTKKKRARPDADAPWPTVGAADGTSEYLVSPSATGRPRVTYILTLLPVTWLPTALGEYTSST
jgi:hypothetical protein